MLAPFRSLISIAILLTAIVPTCISAPASSGLTTRGGISPSLAGPERVIAPGTYPRANKLLDSSIILAYAALVDGNNVITTTHSTDGGATWQKLGEVARGPSDANDIDNPYVLQLPSGRVLVAYRNHSRDPATGIYTFFRITVSYSDDHGATWKYLSQPASDPGPVNGNWEPYLRNGPGGVELYYSRETSAQDQDTLMRRSSDGGKTWSTTQIVSGSETSNTRDGMTSVVTVSGNTLVCVFEVSANGIFSIWSVTSPDNGASWGNRHVVYNPTGSNNNAGSPQVINVGGTLVVSFMTDEDTQQHAWPSGANAKIITSGDGGKTWGHKITVGQQQTNWPGMLVIDDNSLTVMYERGGVKAQEVTLNSG
ncbi:MAG: hypothetical protein M1836_000279 [Candelina mexicana]|nr:MAG: hypothetical protein M1836_000279 [Candelina mexicana]